MASWREIEKFKKDAVGSRALASRLLDYRYDGLTEWEADFAESIAKNGRADELSTRQAEKLLEIRDATELSETVRGFSIKLLFEQCHRARLDLSEADEQWIVALAAKAPVTALRRRDAYRLLACAGELDIIEKQEDFT